MSPLLIVSPCRLEDSPAQSPPKAPLPVANGAGESRSRGVSLPVFFFFWLLL